MIDFTVTKDEFSTFRSHATSIPKGLKLNEWATGNREVYDIEKADKSFLNYGFTKEEIDHIQNALKYESEVGCAMLPDGKVSVVCLMPDGDWSEVWWFDYNA